MFSFNSFGLCLLAGVWLLCSQQTVATDPVYAYYDQELVADPSIGQNGDGVCVALNNETVYDCPEGYRLEGKTFKWVYYKECAWGQEAKNLEKSVRDCSYKYSPLNSRDFTGVREKRVWRPVCMQLRGECKPKSTEWYKFKPGVKNYPKPKGPSRCPNEKKDPLKMWTLPAPIPSFSERIFFRYASSKGARFDFDEIPSMLYEKLFDIGFDKNAPTKIVIHGFWNNAWFGAGEDIATAYKKRYEMDGRPINVIIVNWGVYNNPFDLDYLKDKFKNIFTLPSNQYDQHASMIKYVGMRIANLIELLVTCGGTSPDKIHITGHSLGAHIAGIAGRAFAQRVHGKVGRITALDPAAPCFVKDRMLNVWVCRNADADVSLEMVNENDAQFVDAIHTHGEYLGVKRRVGHADFYPNGGICQRGCRWPLVPCNPLDVCSHMRAVDLMVESIIRPAIRSWWSSDSERLADVDEFKAQRCQSEGAAMEETCYGREEANMGEYCSHDTRGVFYLKTNKKSPLSQKHPDSWFPSIKG